MSNPNNEVTLGQLFDVVVEMAPALDGKPTALIVGACVAVAIVSQMPKMPPADLEKAIIDTTAFIAQRMDEIALANQPLPSSQVN